MFSMPISDLIRRLEIVKEKRGDLPIAIGLFTESNDLRCIKIDGLDEVMIGGLHLILVKHHGFDETEPDFHEDEGK